MSRTTALLVLAILLVPGPVRGAAKPAAVLQGCGGRAVEFSRDGGKLMTAGREAARVWDGHTFQPITEPLKHGGEILFTALSANGTRVLTAGSNHIARTWDADTGRLLASINTGDEIHSAAVSPDGGKIVIGGSKDDATVWDARTGKRLFRLQTTPADDKWGKTAPFIRFVSFTPDGSRVLTVRLRGGSYLWDATTGKQIISTFRDAPVVFGSAERMACPVAFSPDGTRAISVSDWDVVVSDTTTGKSVCPALDTRGGEKEGFLGWTTAVAFGPDHDTFAVAGNSVGVWKIRNSKAVFASEEVPPAMGATDLVFSRDGKRYLLAAVGDEAGVYDVQTGKQILQIADRGETPLVAYAPDGKHVAAGFELDGRTTIWSVPDTK